MKRREGTWLCLTHSNSFSLRLGISGTSLAMIVNIAQLHAKQRECEKPMQIRKRVWHAILAQTDVTSGQPMRPSTQSFPIRTVRFQCGTCAALFAVCPQTSGRCMICGFAYLGIARQTVATPSCFCQIFYKVVSAQLIQHTLEECVVCGVCCC